MKLQGSARSCPDARRLLGRKVLQDDWSLAGVAKTAGLSCASANRWQRRSEVEGDARLHDRSMRPKHNPGRTLRSPESRVRALRRAGLVAVAIALRLGLPRSTVGAILRRHEPGRLTALEPRPQVIRYERKAAGELLRVDTK